MKVTKEDVSDSTMLKPIVLAVASSIYKVIVDRIYDFGHNFRYLDQVGIRQIEATCKQNKISVCKISNWYWTVLSNV